MTNCQTCHDTHALPGVEFGEPVLARCPDCWRRTTKYCATCRTDVDVDCPGGCGSFAVHHFVVPEHDATPPQHHDLCSCPVLR